MTPLLSIEESAKILNVSAWTIRKWLTQGKLNHVKLGRRVLIEPSTLNKLIENGRRQAAASV